MRPIFQIIRGRSQGPTDRTQDPGQASQKLDTYVDTGYQRSGGNKTYTSAAERVALLI